ncbi:MAG: hypothetical protein KatS3mg044_1467 [Rhodothermaceae bacterium]|nr:MAG: hypothetical protein KatS3mg044_1467 [Rhodothermaceae bacterium]
MHVTLSFTVVPFTVAGSVAPHVARCLAILDEAGLTYRLHANGTDVEGPWDDVFAAIRRCHEVLHAEGVDRLFTTIQVGTRRDRPTSLEDKVRRVEAIRRRS